jgi:hypothetical protein
VGYEPGFFDHLAQTKLITFKICFVWKYIYIYVFVIVNPELDDLIGTIGGFNFISASNVTPETVFPPWRRGLVVSSPPATEETATDREIESHQGIGW